MLRQSHNSLELNSNVVMHLDYGAAGILIRDLTN